GLHRRAGVARARPGPARPLLQFHDLLEPAFAALRNQLLRAALYDGAGHRGESALPEAAAVALDGDAHQGHQVVHVAGDHHRRDALDTAPVNAGHALSEHAAASAPTVVHAAVAAPLLRLVDHGRTEHGGAGLSR